MLRRLRWTSWGQGVLVAPVLERLGGLAQVQGQGLALLLVRGLLLHQPDQVLLHSRGLAEPAVRAALDSLVDECGENGVVGHYAHLGQVVQGRPYARAVQTGVGHQLVGGYSDVRCGVHQPAGDVQELTPVGCVNLPAVQAVLRLLEAGHHQGGGEDIHLVRVP